MIQHSKIIFLIILLLSIVVISNAQEKVLSYENMVYEDQIKTVRLFTNNQISPAIIPIQQYQPLILTFDDIYADLDYYNAKIIHCTKDWTLSSLQEMNYLPDFNEFPIRDYETSINARIPYYHYRFQIPKVKVSGNYLVVVYRDTDPEDIILSHRFMVYEEFATIDANIIPSNDPKDRYKNHQIEFDINYEKAKIINPGNRLSVRIRQNQRTDNTITAKPFSIREDRGLIEYRSYNLENNFKAGNEFRFFDLRSVNYGGQNVVGIDVFDDKVEAYIAKDKKRSFYRTPLIQDIDGQYRVENIQSKPSELTSEYVYVNFLLKAERISSDLYITGAFSNWNYEEKYKMRYNTSKEAYEIRLLLKQGWYNYMYIAPSHEDPYYFEASRVETRNSYEIIIYYSPMQSRGDRIVGYKRFSN